MKTLEEIYKNNRQCVGNYIQLKINELEKEKDIMSKDMADLFKQAKEVILNSDIK